MAIGVERALDHDLPYMEVASIPRELLGQLKSVSKWGVRHRKGRRLVP